MKEKLSVKDTEVIEKIFDQVHKPEQLEVLRLVKNLFRVFIVIDENRAILRKLSDKSSNETAKRAMLLALTKTSNSEDLTNLVMYLSSLNFRNEEDLLFCIEETAIHGVLYSAFKDNKLDFVEEELLQVMDFINGQLELNKILSDKTIPRAKRTKLVDTIFRKRVDSRTFALLKYSTSFIETRRFAENLLWINNIIGSQLNRVVVKVKTPFEFTEDQKDRLTNKLENKYKKEIALSFNIDPGLIGGVQLSVQSDFYDNTIKTKLNNFIKETRNG